MGEAGSLENKADMESVGKFGNRLRKIIVYPKFGHMLDALMVSFSKALMNELIIEVLDHALDTW